MNNPCNMHVIQVSGRPPAEITEIAEEVETADSEAEEPGEVRIDSFYFLLKENLGSARRRKNPARTEIRVRPQRHCTKIQGSTKKSLICTMSCLCGFPLSKIELSGGK